MTPLDDRFARELPEMAIAWKAAVPPAPQLLLLNEPVATSLGLDPEWLRTPEGIRFLSGVGVPAVAQAYAGHQFGGFNPRLGDGRAVLLGNIAGQDLHLKGSGATPFSRGGDGFAAVGPMLREYVVSEAMHALGVPTTRALAVIATGAPVHRETVLPGALLARVATSHLRVGSFQFARATDDLDLLTRLAAHAGSRSPLELFSGVVAAQASLIAQWMLLGFIHGVMNTDNMTISGETIDYGPCAFMEAFDPATVFSSIDREGRYAYGQQPLIGEWNLTRLAEAMLPLFSPSEDEAIALATDVLRGYRPAYGAAWQDGMRAKLGLVSGDVASLAADLQEQMHQSRIDHTSFFRRLASSDPSLRDDFVDRSRFDAWLSQWSSLSPDVALMDRVNPVYIPRNHLLEEALAAATLGDLSLVQRLLEAVTSPYDEVPGFEKYALPGDLPDYQTFCGT